MTIYPTIPCPICGALDCDGECDHGPEDGDNLSDVEADAMTLRDAGMGTDEDYGPAASEIL